MTKAQTDQAYQAGALPPEPAPKPAPKPVHKPVAKPAAKPVAKPAPKRPAPAKKKAHK